MECISIELALSCACAWPGLSLWRLPVPQPTICVRRPSTLHLCTSSRSERKSNSSNGLSLWRPRDWRPRDSDWRPRDWRRRPRFGYDCPLLDGHRMAACVCVLCGASLYAVCLSFVFGPATHHATFTFKHSKGIDPRTWHVRGGGRAHRTPHASAPESGSSIGACGPRARAACCKRRGRGVCPSGFSQRSPPARQILHRSAGTRKRGSRCRGISSQSRETSEISDNTSA